MNQIYIKNGDKLYKFCQVCYLTDVVRRRKLRIVEVINRGRQNSLLARAIYLYII